MKYSEESDYPDNILPGHAYLLARRRTWPTSSSSISSPASTLYSLRRVIDVGTRSEVAPLRPPTADESEPWVRYETVTKDGIRIIRACTLRNFRRWVVREVEDKESQAPPVLVFAD